MAQLYPGYDCEQVTAVASRIPDTIVAFGQTRHNTFREELTAYLPSIQHGQQGNGAQHFFYLGFEVLDRGGYDERRCFGGT
jgi:hypothetical protein